MLLGIDIIFLHVQDSQKMCTWYQEKLGLAIKFRTNDGNWQEFSFLHTESPTRFALEYPGKSPSCVEQQPIMISFLVDDIQKTVKDLESRGIEFIGLPKIQEEGPSYFATFKDPEGNWLQISQRK